MNQSNLPLPSSTALRVRPIALPTEHGGWGLLLEPVFLGLLIMPSVGGMYLALAAVGLFLARHPLKLTFTDFYRDRKSRRTALAIRFAILYLSLTAVAFILACAYAKPYFWWPFLVAGPVAVVQASFDFVGRSRAMLAELAGPVAIAAVAAAIVLAGGSSNRLAICLWTIQVCRGLPAIFYLRTRLRLIRKKPTSIGWMLLTQVVATTLVAILTLKHWVPVLSLMAFLVLLARAWWGVKGEQEQIAAKTLGIRELIFGAMTVLATAAGYAFQL
jgi:YwiC-like protein